MEDAAVLFLKFLLLLFLRSMEELLLFLRSMDENILEELAEDVVATLLLYVGILPQSEFDQVSLALLFAVAEERVRRRLSAS